MDISWLNRKTRHRNAAELIAKGAARKIRIHSVAPEPLEGGPPKYLRIAFEFLDPPGPYSMQFYRALPNQGVLESIVPGLQARFYESEDEARVRVMTLQDGTAVLAY